MANLNKVMLIGRLTRDVETRSFNNGGKVAKFGFCVNNRKKNSQTQQWEEVPMFIDCEAFNRGNYTLADLVEKYLAKGKQVFLEGRLELDQWDDKTTGQKRSKHKLVVEGMQFLDSGDRSGQPGGEAHRSGPSDAYSDSGPGEELPNPPAGPGPGEDIPF